jgi:hypothetical protein
MRRRIDLRVMPEIQDKWRLPDDVALRMRDIDAVDQVVAVGQFRDHLRRRAPRPATELPRCATKLAPREV